MSKTEEKRVVLKAFLKQIGVIIIATGAIDLCFWALTGFEGELTAYPYKKANSIEQKRF
jgi:hypothetical protein